MNPHPRIRKTVKWGGLAVTVLLVGVWVGTGWVSATWLSREGTGFSFYTGRLGLGFGVWRDNPTGERHLRLACDAWMMQWSFETDTRGSGWVLAIPLWAPACLALMATAVAWRVDARARRREQPHLCSKCGYDRTGLAVGSPCPECGSSAPAVNP